MYTDKQVIDAYRALNVLRLATQDKEARECFREAQVFLMCGVGSDKIPGAIQLYETTGMLQDF